MNIVTKLEPDGSEKNDLQIIDGLINNPLVLIFIHDFPIVVFFIANLFIYLIITHYIPVNPIIPPIISPIIFVLGFVSSLAIIKTHYFLDLKSIHERVSKLYHSLFDRNGSKTQKLPKMSLSEFFAFFSRNLFFNLLNDSFILLIFWLIVFALLIVLSIVSVTDSQTISEFSILIGLIGIISGLFQFYVKDYKEKNMEIITSLVRERIASASQISFSDFKQFLKDGHHDSFLQSIDDIIKGKYSEGKAQIVNDTAIKGRKGQTIFNIFNPPNRPINQHNRQIFEYLEIYPEGQLELNKNQLLYYYKSYFESKQEQIKNEDNEDKIKELRRLVFTTIIFSDDILFSYLKFFSDIPKKTAHPKSFQNYYDGFINFIIYDLFNAVLFCDGMDKKDDS